MVEAPQHGDGKSASRAGSGDHGDGGDWNGGELDGDFLVMEVPYSKASNGEEAMKSAPRSMTRFGA